MTSTNTQLIGCVNMNDLSRKNELTQAFMNVELVPSDIQSSLALNDAKSISYDDLMIMGGTITGVVTPIVAAIKSTVGRPLYYATDIHGNPIKHALNTFNDGSGILGSYFDKAGSPHQARLHKVNINLTTTTVVAIAAAIVIKGITEKLNAIQETQQDILNFLQDDKRASLKANIDFLMDILSNYKYNWDNGMYKNNMHMKVLDIRQSAEHNIEFYRLRVAEHIAKKKKIIFDKNTKSKLSKIQADLEDYRTALNLFAFSSYVEVLLLENYSSDYLNGISSKIRDKSLQYRETYTECYTVIKKYLESSVDSVAIKGVAAASKATGKVVEKIPLLSRTQLDENLIEAHSKLNKRNDERPDNILKRLTSCKDVSATSFADQIDSISKLYNQPTIIYFDEKMVYMMPA